MRKSYTRMAERMFDLHLWTFHPDCPQVFGRLEMSFMSWQVAGPSCRGWSHVSGEVRAIHPFFLTSLAIPLKELAKPKHGLQVPSLQGLKTKLCCVTRNVRVWTGGAEAYEAFEQNLFAFPIPRVPQSAELDVWTPPDLEACDWLDFPTCCSDLLPSPCPRRPGCRCPDLCIQLPAESGFVCCVSFLSVT